MSCVTAAVLPDSNGGHEYPREPERRASRLRYGRGQPPASGVRGTYLSTRFEERLDMLLGRQDLDLHPVIRYLVGYAAALRRSATHHTPDKPGPTAQELLASVHDRLAQSPEARLKRWHHRQQSHTSGGIIELVSHYVAKHAKLDFRG
jgi:hypothetical protein